MKIGILSDTHGLLRSEALSALQGVEHILHAGDIGDALILDQLRLIAPVTAVRGNIDRSGPCAKLPASEILELHRVTLYMLHDVHELDLDPRAAGIQVVVSGHSHQPLIEWKRGVLYFNPGSVGPKRFSLPVSLGFLEVSGAELTPSLYRID
jgi:putative phosphoesterase